MFVYQTGIEAFFMVDAGIIEGVRLGQDDDMRGKEKTSKIMERLTLDIFHLTKLYTPCPTSLSEPSVQSASILHCQK